MLSVYIWFVDWFFITQPLSKHNEINIRMFCWYYCLFVCMFGVYHPTRQFFTHMGCHHYRWRAENFDQGSALMTIEQGRFFSEPHLPWHRASVYNGHLRGRVTLTPVAERLAVGLLLRVLRLRSVAVGFRTPREKKGQHLNNQTCLKAIRTRHSHWSILSDANLS